MPILMSPQKELRKAKKRRIRNLARKEAMKDVIKQIRRLVSEKKINEAIALLPRAYKAFDKAAKSGVIKKNTAARKKSHISRYVRAMSVK